MKKRVLNYLIIGGILFSSTLNLISCNKEEPSINNGDNNNDDEPTSNVVSSFTKGDDNHLQEEEKEIDTIRFHYHRFNDLGTYSSYLNWHLWCWDLTNGGSGSWYEFTHYDEYGVYADVKISDVKVASSSIISSMGFIVASGEWSAKDPDGDRSVSLEGDAPGGIKDIYLISGSENIYEDKSLALTTSISSARFNKESLSIIELYFSLVGEFSFDKSKLKVLVNYEEVEISSIEANTTSKYLLTISKEIKLTDVVKVRYEFNSSFTDEKDVIATDYFSSEEFNNNYYYDKDDLGVSFDNELNPSKTTFKVWAPTSSKVVLKVYKSGDYETDLTPLKEEEMILKDKGVYSLTISEDLDGYYYTYEVTNQKGVNEVVDPYAKSAGINGKRGMVVNFTKLNKSITNWNKDIRPEYGDSPTDASIYEIHVRDMTINPNSGVSSSNRGKYLGLTEKNTKYEENGKSVTTGLSHLKELGITHVQIQPIYDFTSVEEKEVSSEMSKSNYNWGYDPQNYNVLEGSYSSNPSDGYNRIIEFKKMVMALHDEGININMDVVYNHTSLSENSSLNLLVPYYYYRTSSEGKFYNGSGCGNEIASNRKMVRKFIVDSTLFWTSEYHLSGFRFDLMGLIDNQTMIDVYKENKALYEGIMVYGEPWDMGNLLTQYSENNLDNQKTVQKSLGQTYFAGSGNLVGGFNDTIRNATKGNNDLGKGYVQGNASNVLNIVVGIKGQFADALNVDKSVEPTQVINYVSCHDNYTLYDQLVQTLPSSRTLLDAYLQSEAIVFTSQGIPFIQEGEDFLRTKSYIEYGQTKYNGNSYNVGDYINNMDYSLKLENIDTFEKIKELISLRKKEDDFRLSRRSEVDEKLNIIEKNLNTGLIIYEIDNETRIIHSLNGDSISLDSKYDLIYSTTSRDYLKDISSIELNKNESVVLKKVD